MIGCAYIGVLCGSRAYRVNWVMHSTNAKEQQILAAHEMGNNCGANHINSKSNIMNLSISRAQNGFSSQSTRAMNKRFFQVQCIDEEENPIEAPTAAPNTSITVPCVLADPTAVATLCKDDPKFKSKCARWFGGAVAN